MQELYASGQTHYLSVYFQAVAFAGPFYIGLGTGAVPEGRTLTLADVVEVTGTGYARKSVTRTSTPGAGWVLDDNVVTSPTLVFTNSNVDPENYWTDADYVFLTLSPSGTTAPNVLLGAVEMETVVLGGGESEEIVFSFSMFNTAP